MVEVLVIPDGAAQPIRRGVPTALEAARTPVLDALAAEGEVARVATTPPGLAPGSETCIPTLLGHPPGAPVGRGRVDAAAHGVEVPDGSTPWRADVFRPGGARASRREATEVARHLPTPPIVVCGHRLLLLADARPPDLRVRGFEVRVWDDGPAPAGVLEASTTLIGGPGAAAGCGRLLGAHVTVPVGATGDVDTDLFMKARVAAAAISDGRPRVVVHVGGPDEAAHRRNPDQVIAALERLDSDLLAPLCVSVDSAGGRLIVCPDHGTDPLTGRHDSNPVPGLRWGAGIAPAGPDRMNERAAAAATVRPPEWLFELEAVAA